MTVAQFAAAPITLYAPLTSIAGIDSQQIVPPAPTLLGGMIYNPARPHDQGLSISEHPFPPVNTRFSEEQGSFSPDVQWFAYVSHECGRGEIYVQ